MTEWWNNPCPDSHIPDAKYRDFQSWKMDDLINQVDITISEANRAKEDYAQNTFFKSFDNLFVDGNYSWLPTLPKKYGEQVSEGVLQSKTPADILGEIYKYLQIYGVAIDLAANETVVSSPDEVFVSKRAELKLLLCEFKSFLSPLGIFPSLDVKASVVPDTMRNLDTSSRDRRNYIIYKEYLNCLEYLDQTLKYLKDLQQSNQ